MNKILKFSLLSLIYYFSNGSTLNPEDLNQNPSSEFEIFEKSADEKSSPKKEYAGLQVDLVVQKQFSRNSIFIPDENFAALDSWVFTGFMRFTKNPQLSSFFGINVDLGLRNTTNSRDQALQTVNYFSGLSDTLNSVHPMFENELSFLHFYAYEFSFNFSLLPTEADSIFLAAGILPVKSGNSFYKNPVSFFERYLPPRDYIQEYSPLSFPAIQLTYIREIYHIDILFVPDIPYQDIGDNHEGSNIADYLYFVNSANILMVKNSLDFSTVHGDLYFFWENKSKSDDRHHFGFGAEITWRIIKDLNISGQFMASNGRIKYEVSEENFFDSVFYTLNPVENSGKEFRFESLVSFSFSGLKNFDISLGYYYNGFGYSQSEYASLTNALDKAKNGYASNDIFLQSLHLMFFTSVLAQYDLFALNRHYLFVNIVNLQNLEIFTWGASAFFTLENFSVMPVLFTNFNINSNLKLYLQLTANTGLAGSVFGESLIAGSINGGIQWSF